MLGEGKGWNLVRDREEDYFPVRDFSAGKICISTCGGQTTKGVTAQKLLWFSIQGLSWTWSLPIRLSGLHKAGIYMPHGWLFHKGTRSHTQAARSPSTEPSLQLYTSAALHSGLTREPRQDSGDRWGHTRGRARRVIIPALDVNLMSEP